MSGANEVNIRFIDINGKVVKTYQETGIIGVQSTQLDISELSAGIYFCEINVEDRIIRKKLIISR